MSKIKVVKHSGEGILNECKVLIGKDTITLGELNSDVLEKVMTDIMMWGRAVVKVEDDKQSVINPFYWGIN